MYRCFKILNDLSRVAFVFPFGPKPSVLPAYLSSLLFSEHMLDILFPFYDISNIFPRALLAFSHL